MTSLRNNYQMTSPNVCSVLTRLLKASLSLLESEKMQQIHATSIWNFFCIRCMVVKVFWALIHQRKWKETLSRWQKRQELHSYYLPSMIDDFEKKCCVYKARTHSLTTFGPQGFDKIVYFILYFNLKQLSLGGVIYPAEFVF